MSGLLSTSSNKKYFRMGEVCTMTELEPHVIRFWESEFSELSPRKTRTGHRTFTEDEVDLIFRIKRLLHDEGYTIAGARKKLAGSPSEQGVLDTAVVRRRFLGEIAEIKGLLKNVLNMLDRDSGV